MVSGDPHRSLHVVDEQYERMRARLLAAIAEHERGELDHAGLQTAIEGVRGALGNAHADVRQALFEADVALEYAQSGRPPDGSDPAASLKRVRRNLREALG
jgi:hemoglobin-like flavoprotein